MNPQARLPQRGKSPVKFGPRHTTQNQGWLIFAA
jgi:hypothetical protein